MTEARHSVTFLPDGTSATVEAGSTIKRAAEIAGIPLDFPCGGLGTCGRCVVSVRGEVEEPAEDERLLLGSERLSAGIRLACRTRVAGDVTVTPVALPAGGLRVVEIGLTGEITVESPEARGISGAKPLLGAVVDVGTTTVVASVIDLESAAELGSASALNPQHPFGHDVMSRISHVAMNGIDSLQRPIVGGVQALLEQVLAGLGETPERLREIAIAGNTTMVHLLLGIDPAPLGVAPYEPAFLEPVQRPASDIGLEFPNASLYVLPGISAFIGADITAGLLATGIAEQRQPVLLVDLGTNGEMVLRTTEGLVAASTAAGPALEGASIAYGMRAEKGAIERVGLDGGDLVVETIGAVTPRGICGSGLLDLIAVLLDTGLIDETGRMRDDASHPMAARIAEKDGSRAFEIASGVFLTQRDVRQVQLATAAISSGIEMLLGHAGIEAADVEKLVIAGGFGYHVRPSAIVRMGMVRPLWEDHIEFAGNTAKSGAVVALLDSSARRRAAVIARHVETFDLAADPQFQTKFVAAMRFPRARG